MEQEGPVQWVSDLTESQDYTKLSWKCIISHTTELNT